MQRGRSGWRRCRIAISPAPRKTPALPRRGSGRCRLWLRSSRLSGPAWARASFRGSCSAPCRLSAMTPQWLRSMRCHRCSSDFGREPAAAALRHDDRPRQMVRPKDQPLPCSISLSVQEARPEPPLPAGGPGGVVAGPDGVRRQWLAMPAPLPSTTCLQAAALPKWSRSSVCFHGGPNEWPCWFSIPMCGWSTRRGLSCDIGKQDPKRDGSWRPILPVLCTSRMDDSSGDLTPFQACRSVFRCPSVAMPTGCGMGGFG